MVTQHKTWVSFKISYKLMSSGEDCSVDVTLCLNRKKSARNQHESSKTRESRNGACERCAASCLEDSGRIRKALEASQWRPDLSDPEGACLRQRRPARTVHSCADCYLQPSLSLTLAHILTISSVWRPGPALRRCCGSRSKICSLQNCADLCLFTISCV